MIIQHTIQHLASHCRMQTVPIYNLDASPSNSDSDDLRRRGGPPVRPPIDTNTFTTADGS